MNMLRKHLDIRNLASLALCLIALAVPGIASAVEAGKFQFVNGDIKVISASGAERKPVKGEAFNPGDTVITGAGGSAQIRMTDGGFVAIRPDTQMKLDQYVFNGREDGSERKLVSLIKGGFRAITGLIGNRNKENYRIITPSATIGIRGTDHEAVVIPPGATGGFQVGTYDRVYRGATIIETDKGKLIVNPNQVGFTPGKGVAPVLLPKIPEFYDTRLQKPDVVKDPQKESKDSDGGDSRKTDAKSTSVRSRPALRETDSKDATTLRNPLDANVKDLGTSTRKTDALTPISPLTDTAIRSITTTSTLTDTSTTAIKTDTLTAPISTTPLISPTTTITTTPITTISPITTKISPITTTISPITTTAPITTPAPVTTTAPLTTTIQKTAPILTAPLTTTITR